MRDELWYISASYKIGPDVLEPFNSLQEAMDSFKKRMEPSHLDPVCKSKGSVTGLTVYCDDGRSHRIAAIAVRKADLSWDHIGQAKSLPKLADEDLLLLRQIEKVLSETNQHPALLFDVRWRIKHSEGM
jgi:hypothetical protein